MSREAVDRLYLAQERV